MMSSSADRPVSPLVRCRNAVREMIAHIFTRTLDGVMTMALAEVLSHVNMLVDDGRLVAGGTPEFRALSAP